MMQVARMVFPGFWFGQTPEEEAIELAKLGVGGFCLYGGTKTTVATLTRKLRAASPLPHLLIAADYEDGLGRWLADAELLPSNLAIGAADDEQLAFEKGFITAREACAVGVDWIFAPVVDLANNAQNPIVNTRSFGANPQQVIRLAKAFMQGVNRGGALNCLKHFPGHGNTRTDSHLAMPVVTETKALLKTTSLAPFQALLPLADSVMIGHLLVPALDGTNPASLSKNIIHDLLIKKMGFTRCICTDALLMKAINDEKTAAMQALDAGAHILLVPQNPLELIQFLQTQIFSDDMLLNIEQTLDSLCAQAEELAASAEKTPISPSNFTLRTAYKSITQQGFIPVMDPGETLHFLEIGNDENISSVPFFDTLRAYGVVTEPFQNEADSLLILFWRRYKPFSGKIGLTPEESQLVTNAIRRSQQATLLCFANPWMASKIEANGKLFMFSPSPIFQQVAAECLMGKCNPCGKLPIEL